jgi:hypothetical protein
LHIKAQISELEYILNGTPEENVIKIFEKEKPVCLHRG